MLAMTSKQPVIARVLAPVAIFCMEQVRLLYLSIAGDCFAMLAMTSKQPVISVSVL